MDLVLLARADDAFEDGAVHSLGDYPLWSLPHRDAQEACCLEWYWGVQHRVEVEFRHVVGVVRSAYLHHFL